MTGMESKVVTIAAEAEILEERSVEDLLAEISPLPAWLGKTLYVLLPLLIILLPLCFGAVHEAIYLPVASLIFLCCTAVLMFGRKGVTQAFPAGSFGSLTLLGLSIFFVYAVLQGTFLATDSEPHPVLGLAPRLPDPSAFYTALLMLGFFVGSYMLLRISIQVFPKFHTRLLNAMFISGAIVSLVALTHWFYDNGKLFWTFEPDNVFVSERARWPFVNSNHLAHYLLPIFFLLIARISNQAAQLGIQHSASERQLKRLSSLAESTRLQRRVVAVGLGIGLILAVLLAIFGTLSRSSWLGLSIGLIVYYFLTKSSGGAPQETLPYLATSKRRRRSSSESKRGEKGFSFAPVAKFLVRLARPGFVVLALVLTVFFLSERGRDLFAQRLDYGLMYSKDDIRWQMYSDTLPMISEHTLFGVGFGGWDAVYASLKTPLLAGLKPVYLHSDPLQLIAECGAVGASFIFALVFVLGIKVVRTARTLMRTKPEEGRFLSALFSGVLGFLIGSCLDFPFRMPAILFSLALYLALTTFYLDKSTQPS